MTTTKLFAVIADSGKTCCILEAVTIDSSEFSHLEGCDYFYEIGKVTRRGSVLVDLELSSIKLYDSDVGDKLVEYFEREPAVIHAVEAYKARGPKQASSKLKVCWN